MGKAGNRIIAGAQEALKIARGEAMPAKVTAFGWMWWHPIHGFDYGSLVKHPLPTHGEWKAVEVRITTVSNGDNR